MSAVSNRHRHAVCTGLALALPPAALTACGGSGTMRASAAGEG
ncbi:hypothetical protein [Streptomyces bungoensis]|nr:hypothetical protein [Streptomyces bungoensis]